MANVRRLKKDVEFVTAQLVGDCIDYIEYFEDANHDEAVKILSEAVALHNEMIDRINHPNGKDNPKVIREYFKAVRKDFAEGINKGYEKLEELVKA